jgi:hypothetical protein
LRIIGGSTFVASSLESSSSKNTIEGPFDTFVDFLDAGGGFGGMDGFGGGFGGGCGGAFLTYGLSGTGAIAKRFPEQQNAICILYRERKERNVSNREQRKL